MTEERDSLSPEERVRRRERELEAIRRVTRALSSATEEASVVRTALHTALEVVNAEAGSVLLYEPDSGRLEFRYVEGGGGDRLRGSFLAVTEGIAGEVFRSGHSRVSQDVRAEREHAKSVGIRAGYATRNMVTVPLSQPEGQPLGVMQVLNKRKGPLDEADLRVLEILASEVALAIAQARLYREAKVAEVVRLLGDISHDVKNMITPVVACADILEAIIGDLRRRPRPTDGREDEQHSARGIAYDPGFHVEAIAMLRDAACRIQDRVKEIADCVKGVTTPLRLAPCDLNTVASQVVRMLRPVGEHDQIEVWLQEGTDLPLVEADADRLYSMLYNLADNGMEAIRRAQRPGRVTIAAAAGPAGPFPEGRFVSVEVTDTGCGMGPETLRSLFTPAVRSTAALGTGLGTKIIRDAVEAHGGEIAVESALGMGTTFRVKLPLSQQ